MTYAELVTATRKRLGMSQTKLADQAKYDHSYVSRLENGQRTPTIRAVRRINDALGIEPDSKEAMQMMNAAGFTNGQELITPKWNSVIALNKFLESKDTAEMIKVSMDAVVQNIVAMTQYGTTKENTYDIQAWSDRTGQTR